MKTFCLTDPGKVRDHNEDSVLIINKKVRRCFVSDS